MRGLARLLLLLLLAGSLATTGLTLARIAADPALRALRDATADEIAATTDRLLAQEATPARLGALIEARLAEVPRNWLALDALMAVAEERQVVLPQGLAARLAEARDQDNGMLALTASCATCAWDAASCPLTMLFTCQAPVALSPVGDVLGIARAGVAATLGNDVDEIDLALSIVGLGATVAVVASGGSSIVLKAGASLAKTAHKLGRLSPKLVDMARVAARTGLDWAALPAVRSSDDLAAAIRPAAFAPLATALTDLDRLRQATDVTTALHLLPLVDDSADAARLARSAEALGPRLVGRAEVLGKARLFRATMRITEAAYALAAGFIGLVLAIAGLLGGLAQTLALRLLRRIAR